MFESDDITCIRCFQDNNLKEYIRENGTKGDCPWCGAKNTYVIPLIELGPLFRKVISEIYSQEENQEEWGCGDSIAYLLQEDWQIFSDRIEEDPDLMNRLTIAILEAGLHPKNDVDEPDYSGVFKRDDPLFEDDWYEQIEKLMTKKVINQPRDENGGGGVEYLKLFSRI